MRLLLHAAASRLMWTVREALPQADAIRIAEFASIRLRLIKVAARVVETATRIRIAFASALLDAAQFRHECQLAHRQPTADAAVPTIPATPPALEIAPLPAPPETVTRGCHNASNQAGRRQTRCLMNKTS